MGYSSGLCIAPTSPSLLFSRGGARTWPRSWRSQSSHPLSARNVALRTSSITYTIRGCRLRLQLLARGMSNVLFRRHRACNQALVIPISSALVSIPSSSEYVLRTMTCGYDVPLGTRIQWLHAIHDPLRLVVHHRDALCWNAVISQAFTGNVSRLLRYCFLCVHPSIGRSGLAQPRRRS